MIRCTNQAKPDPVQLRANLQKLAGTHLFAPMRTEPKAQIESNRWCDAITRMLDVGYAFDSVEFNEGDGSARPCIFRGLAAGLTVDAEDSQRPVSPAFASERDSGLFERTFGVQFYSHEVSDALTVCGEFDAAADSENAIAVLDAHVFNEAHERGDAAALAIGDSGHVFRYPFIATPLKPGQIVALFVDPTHASRLRRQAPIAAHGIIAIERGSRADTEGQIQSELARLGLTPARAGAGGSRPRRDDLFEMPVCTVDAADDRALP